MSTLRSSQISIYNYPEHLNPFYEDDQHKRIRFWKIKKEEKKPFSERRGSFNLGSLKDLLPLRSFRLSKKRSSNLGINKTSESPPVIRREAFSENLSAYDPKNRVSLENIFANRNSRYRSTIGPTTTSFTPTPRSRYTFNNGMTPGSSMNSVASTNPFELETDDDEASRFSRSSLTVADADHRKRYRKKRRAPLPPERKIDQVMQDVVLRIDEPSGDGLEELSRLTAEFENFVKDSNNDDVINNNVSSHDDGHQYNIKHQESRLETVTENEVKREVSTVKTHEVKVNGISSSKKPVEMTESKTIEVEKESREFEVKNMRRSPDEVFGENVLTSEDDKSISQVSSRGNSEETHQANDKVIEAPKETHHENNVILKISEKTMEQNDKSEKTQIVSTVVVTQTLSSPVPAVRRKTEIPREETPDYIPTTVREKFHVLKIEENEIPERKVVEENATKIEAIPQEKLHIREETLTTTSTNEIGQKLSSQGFVRVEQPIEFYEPIETFIRRTSISETDKPQVPERRRSVKDIIESINRNQKLLKINQAAPEHEENSERYSYRDKPPVPTKPLNLQKQVNLKFQRQAEHEKSINQLLDDLNDFDKQNSTNEKPQQFPYESDKAETIFEKCNIKIVEQDSREVNPIAKPRRVPDSREWL